MPKEVIYRPENLKEFYTEQNEASKCRYPYICKAKQNQRLLQFRSYKLFYEYTRSEMTKKFPLFQQKEQQVLNDVENAETLSGLESAERL